MSSSEVPDPMAKVWAVAVLCAKEMIKTGVVPDRPLPEDLSCLREHLGRAPTLDEKRLFEAYWQEELSLIRGKKSA